MKIAVLGAGVFGKALGDVLEEKGHNVDYYDPIKFPEKTLSDVLKFSKIILLAVPAENVKELLDSFPAFVFRKPLIVATKGLLSLEYFDKFEEVELLSGAAFASQLEAREDVNLTATGEVAAELFKTNSIKIDRTEDELGVLFCGSLKNLFAVEAGFRKLEVDTIEFEQFIFKAMEELESFLELNGVRRETAKLSCGEGDLRLTCGSEESRNYRFGVSLRGRYSGNPNETTEAIFTVSELERVGLEIPRKAEILKDVVRKIRNDT